MPEEYTRGSLAWVPITLLYETWRGPGLGYELKIATGVTYSREGRIMED